jgi:hypothetical protein
MYIAGLVARIIHTYFVYGFIFVRSFCSIYVDNFKSKVFPYVKSVVSADGSFRLALLKLIIVIIDTIWHLQFFGFFSVYVSSSIPRVIYYNYLVPGPYRTEDDEIKIEHRK